MASIRRFVCRSDGQQPVLAPFTSLPGREWPLSVKVPEYFPAGDWVYVPLNAPPARAPTVHFILSVAPPPFQVPESPPWSPLKVPFAAKCSTSHPNPETSAVHFESA
jgi:hypothetical protein